MSKRGYISRYVMIINKLRTRPFSSFDELRTHVENQVEFLQVQDDDLSVGFSKRTFQRDIREIRSLFGIDIEYSKAQKGYFISQNEMENSGFQRMIEVFDMFNSLNLAQDLKPFVHLEKRRPQGMENLYGLLHAIKHKVQVRFSYFKYLEEERNVRKVEPYALKEFKNRWYVIAKDVNDEGMKSFALDRLADLEITKMSFVPPRDLDIDAYYRYSFGIVGPNDQEPEEIILSFDPHQGKYIKSLPLHHSQQVILDSNRELQVRLKLRITFDLVMELLSFADNMKVIKPQSLIEEIKQAHQRAVDLYE